MKTPRSCTPPRRRAFAILMALASTLLVSSIVLVFFNRASFSRTSAYSSGNLMKADALALSAVDVITTELLQEIRSDGLNDQVVGSFPNQSFIPKTENIVPQTNAGIDRTKAPNLLKVTKNGQPLWEENSTTQGRKMASGVSTEKPSLNRRSIDPTQWESNGLHSALPDDNLEDAPNDPNATATPDWVLVTKGKGIQSLTWDKDKMTDKFNDDYVIGRFAATVYDVSGLIDLNSAGHLDALSNSQQAELAGSQSSLDLPLLIAANSGSNEAFGDNFAKEAFISKFRNSATSGVGTTEYHDAITEKAAKVGRLHAVEGDNLLLSRKDLLRLTKTTASDWGSGVSNSPIHPDGQYLFTHFSRELNQPSFVYPQTAANGAAVRNATTNPNIHDERMSQSGTALDGFAWKAGDPVLARRFSLSRLDLVKFDADPSTDLDLESKLLAYFGITRDSNGGAWEYVGSDGETTVTTIKTLSQVAAIGREPNFFEVLKAAIHDDSLGVTSGLENAASNERGYVPNAPVIDGISDLQILRIGANIIDQYDGDSYPTVIFYDPLPDQKDNPATDYDESAKVELYAYGIEDLPYIQSIGFRTNGNVREIDPSGGLYGRPNNQREIYNQIVPVLWNPHEDIGSDSNGPIPSQLQFYFVGGTRYVLRGQAPGTTNDSDVNDVHHYTANPERESRFNQIGLTGLTGDTDNWNTGSITINSAAFDSFREPEFIKETFGSATGAYFFNDTVLNGVPVTERLPYHATGILGLTLNNRVIAQGRAATSGTAEEPLRTVTGTSVTERAWTGYFNLYRSHDLAIETVEPHKLETFTSTRTAHHFLNAGTQGRGLNAVLRYRDHNGNWQVYNAFASNLAHPEGAVNTPYDEYAMKESANGLNGLWMWMMGPTRIATSMGLQAPGPGPNGSYVHNPNWAWTPVISPGAWANDNWAYINHTWYGAARINDHRWGDEYFIMKSDPRTARYGLSAAFHGKNLSELPMENTTVPGSVTDNRGHEMRNKLPNSDIYRMSLDTGGNAGGGRYYPATWAANYGDGKGSQVFDWASGGGGGRGIARPGDDYYNRAQSSVSNVDSLYYKQNARPVVLNRPFKNVGELGYVFRDMPFKSLDMFSPHSVDAALLDYFTISDSNQGLIAGRINPNSNQADVIEIFLKGAPRNHDGTITISDSDGARLADDFLLASSEPLANVADLVKRFSTEDPDSGGTGTVPRITGTNTGAYPSIKKLREAPVRALSEVTNTRTWNLMVDVVAQSGRYTQASDGLDDFLVEGQQRYWMHLAIDRFSGKIVDKQIEVAQ